MTLFKALTEVREFQNRKHGLGADFVKEDINRLSNYELLEEISQALEDAGVMRDLPPPSD